MAFGISDDFLEVKIDPSSLKEDDLFPASMFEPIPLNGYQCDINAVAMETSGNQSKSGLNQTGNDTAEIIMLDNDSTENSSESYEISHDRKMENAEPDINGILGKADSAERNKLESNEGRVIGNGDVDFERTETDDTEEVPDGVEVGESVLSPDVIERQWSVSSGTSLPDVVENSDHDSTHEIVGSPDNQRVVPDLVKDYQNLDFVSAIFLSVTLS